MTDMSYKFFYGIVQCCYFYQKQQHPYGELFHLERRWAMLCHNHYVNIADKCHAAGHSLKWNKYLAVKFSQNFHWKVQEYQMFVLKCQGVPNLFIFYFFFGGRIFCSCACCKITRSSTLGKYLWTDFVVSTGFENLSSSNQFNI